MIAHLSDPHIGGEWAGDDSVAGFAAAVEAVRSMRRQPDAVLLSGDLADNAADSEYEQVVALLAPLSAPVYVLAGNHDDRDALRRHFGVPGAGGEPVQYSVDLGPLKLVVLDTTVPGEDGGALDDERLGWLEAQLAASPDVPTLVAMHHPPVITGVTAFDSFGLAADGRRALATVIERHPQVRRTVAGHVHHTIVAELADRPVVTVSSTYVQARLHHGVDQHEWVHDPASFAMHVMTDGELTSHFQTLAQRTT